MKPYGAMGRRKWCAQSLVLSVDTRDFSCVPADREISCEEKQEKREISPWVSVQWPPIPIPRHLAALSGACLEFPVWDYTITTL